MKKNKLGFTLVELVVSIGILAVIMLSIFSIYSNIIQTTKKLELYRILQQNIRTITELIATDIREQGVDYNKYSLPGEEKLDKINGNKMLFLKGKTYGVFKKENDNFIFCNEINKCNLDNQKEGIYLGFYNAGDYTNPKIITTDEVIIKNIKFFINGNSSSEIKFGDINSREGKVSIVFEIGISARKGIPTSLAQESVIKIQTTISENFYKKDQ